MTSAEAYQAFRAHGGVADLSSRLKLRLTGADRIRYLNGQVSANVATLTDGRALPACITTAKGKLCAEVVIHTSGEALYLDAEPALKDTLPARLDRFIIADDVQVEDVTNAFHLVHLVGAVAPAADLRAAAALFSHAHRLGREGWDLFLEPAVFDRLWPQLSAALPVLTEDLWEALRVERGVPRWGFELDENTLPPEAGLERTHIDYHKGCYVGQEVISRLKSVGHVNRELSGFIAPPDTTLQPGMRLFPPDNDERPVGALTSVAYSFALEKPIALGYLKRGAAFPELIARPADAAAPEIVLAAHALPLVS